MAKSAGTRHVALALVACITWAGDARATSTVFGGPTYQRVGGGYLYPSSQMPSVIGPNLGPHGGGFYGHSLNDAGLAVGYASYFTSSTSRKGDVAVRWSPGAAAVELQSLPGNGVNPYSYDYALNASGTSVGYSYVYNASGQSLGERAVRWSAGGTSVTPLGNLGASTSGVFYSRAFGINDAGTAVGFAESRSANNDYGFRAVRWNANGTAATELGNLGTSPTGSPIAYCNAYAINNAGTAVGYASKWYTSTSSTSRAVRWDANTTAATELGGIGATPTISNTTALAINDAGTIIGYGEKAGDNNADLGPRAIRWDAGGTTATELGNLGTAPDGTTTTWAAGINRAGTTIGYCYVYGDDPRYPRIQTVRWDAGRSDAVPLPPLVSPDGTPSQSMNCAAINDRGVIAGTAEEMAWDHSSLGVKAVLWLPGKNAPLDLNTLLAPVGPTDPTWKLTSATAISQTGFVSGVGTFDADGNAYNADPYLRHFTILVPQAGTYGDGDANFDTHVDFADLLVLAKHYGQSSNGATDAGDLDLNGVTDFSDLLTLAKHYGTSPTAVLNATGDAAFANDWALAQSLVPEPFAGMACLLAIQLFGSRVRRSDRKPVNVGCRSEH